MNKCMLAGNLCADPELRMTQSGTALLKLRLATNERRKDKSGEWSDFAEYHSVVVWGRRAEALTRLLGKGSAVLVDGALRTSSYDDRDGNKRYRTEVVANEVELTGGRCSGQHESRTAQPASAGERDGGADDGDDIAF